MANVMTGRTARGTLAVALGALATAAAFPAGAQACSIAALTAAPVTPTADALVAPTSDGVPLQVRFPPNSPLLSVDFAIARLKTPQPSPLGSDLPADVGTVVETGVLSYDPVTGVGKGTANGNGWARQAGEYVWRVAATQQLVLPPAVPGVASSCAGMPPVIVHDGRWTHRLTVLQASNVAIAAGKVRDGRVKLRGRLAKAFPGKVRLTIECRGTRTRTGYVTVRDGRWQTRVRAKRGCTVKAGVTAREDWAASEATVRLT